MTEVFYLKTHDLIPPGMGGKWGYLQKESGLWMSGIIYQDVLKKIIQHRANNRYPIVTAPYNSLPEEYDDWVCRRLSDDSRKRLCNSTAPTKRVWRPGEMLAMLISQITGQYPKTCGACNQRIQQMNEWGWIGSFHHRREIIGWLNEEARKRGHAISEKEVGSLFRAAFKELAR